MKALWREARAHRPETTVFVLCWAAIGVFTLATWVFDDSGQTVGMHPAATLLNLSLPLAAGTLVGWWRRSAAGAWDGALTGLHVAEMSLLGESLLWLLIYHLLLGRPLAPGEGGGVLGGLAELLEMVVFAGVFGLVLGGLGGLAGGLLSARARQGATKG